MRARELRRHLEELGVNTTGCVDKDMLMELLETVDKSLLLGGGAPQAGTPGAAPSAGAPEPPPRPAAEAGAAAPDVAAPGGAGAAPGGPEEEAELPGEVQQRLEELRAMRLRDLRRELAGLGLRVEGCVDRESLLELLDSQGAATLLRARAAPPPPPPPGPQAPPRPPGPAAASPSKGTVEVPIFLMTGVDQYGVKAGGTKVITVDLEVGSAIAPSRFVLDTVTEHSLIKARIARSLSAKNLGTPEWASGSEYDIRQVGFDKAWLGKLFCGELKLAAIEGDLPVPIGTCGILGLDFLRLFDWDIDASKERAEVATAPRDGLGPVPFDLEGMRAVPLTPVRLPGIDGLLACPIELRRTGEGPTGHMVECMGIADLGASCTMCNRATLNKLVGVQQEPEEAAAVAGGPEAEPELQELQLEVAMGTGPQGPVRSEAAVAAGDIEVFETMGLGKSWPAAILGPDVLCRSRLIISIRLQSVWLPASG